MKKSEIKAGVVYAYQTSKYSKPLPVVVLDVEKTYADTAPNYGRLDESTLMWNERMGRDGRLQFGKGQGYGSRNVGFLAVGSGVAKGGFGLPEVDADYLARLAKVTLAEVLALRWQDRERIKGTVLDHMGVVNPRYIIGEWQTVISDLDSEAEILASLSAMNKAESDARVAAATERVEALRALGVPGQIAQPAEAKKWAMSSDKEPDTYSGNTSTIRLTLAQIDALLSLIPEGAKIPEASDTEADGWTLRKPEYDQDRLA